nr:phosphodiester glycosidase family protein [Actinomycetota bacterium]
MASASSPLPPGFNVVASASLYSGVDYAKLAKPNTPVVAHVARVAPGAAVDLRVVDANDKISTSPSELEPTSSICRRLHCIVGLNGDFNRAGTPEGAVVIDGRMLHSPDPARPQLTVTGDGHLAAGPFPWTGSLSGADGTRLPVTTVNAAPTGDGLALYTPAYGTRTDPSSRVELVVRAPGGVGTLNAPTDVELRGLRSGAGPIPTDGAVLSGDGVAAQQLRDLWARVQSGTRPHADLLVSSPINAEFSLGAEPVVLRDGRRALPWRDPNVINPRQPHTLVGWNKTGETFLVAIDGRQPASEGMTMAEAADFLVALGATDAVNLDGGGGTTFVAGGSVWNRPSDNDPAHPAQYAERGTANAFVVMPRPGAPLPPATPPAPKPIPRAGSTDPATDGTGGGPPQVLPWDDSPLDAVDVRPFVAIADGGTHL